jgi:hypothetical protein
LRGGGGLVGDKVQEGSVDIQAVGMDYGCGGDSGGQDVGGAGAGVCSGAHGVPAREFSDEVSMDPEPASPVPKLKEIKTLQYKVLIHVTRVEEPVGP